MILCFVNIIKNGSKLESIKVNLLLVFEKKKLGISFPHPPHVSRIFMSSLIIKLINSENLFSTYCIITAYRSKDGWIRMLVVSVDPTNVVLARQLFPILTQILKLLFMGEIHFHCIDSSPTHNRLDTQTPGLFLMHTSNINASTHAVARCMFCLSP